jgi:hypothetical protein
MGEIMTIAKRKPGRPAKPRPSKPSRPLAMVGGVNVTVKLMPDVLLIIDNIATVQGVSRSGWIREAIERALGVKP